MKIVSWNIARRDSAWQALLGMDTDVALLQEAAKPPSDVAMKVGVDAAPWVTPGVDGHRPWRAAVVGLSEDVQVEWLPSQTLGAATSGEVGLSRPGTLAVARVSTQEVKPLYVASMYGMWDKPLASTRSGWIYADASVHRIISDLSALIGTQARHRIIAAGDLNILYGYGEEGSAYWRDRYASVFERMRALGLKFVGPQAPNGNQADPWPAELPAWSRNVPTYHTSRQTPATATRQLDFVFASMSLADNVSVRALNAPSDWGPSDHCRIEIQL